MEVPHTTCSSHPIIVLDHSHTRLHNTHNHTQPQSHTYMVGKCFLKYENSKGIHFLDRNKTPSSYGMIYDDLISLCGIITRCEDL